MDRELYFCVRSRIRVVGPAGRDATQVACPRLVEREQRSKKAEVLRRRDTAPVPGRLSQEGHKRDRSLPPADMGRRGETDKTDQTDERTMMWHRLQSVKKGVSD